MSWFHHIAKLSVPNNSSGSQSLFFRPKLSINRPGDQYEKEADTVADKVVRTKTPFIQEKPVTISTIQRKCAHCKEEEKEIQRKEMGSEEVIPGSFDDYVNGLNGAGHQLPNEVRNFYEPRFGYDFSHVKVHTDAVAARSAQSINALAYTSGNNIVFNSGQYSPNTDTGKRLLGHELTHVIQQSNKPGQVSRQEDPSANQPEIEPPPNSFTLDLFDPLNSSIRIGGFRAPSVRNILDGLEYMRQMAGTPGPDGRFQWPPAALSDEQLREAGCRIAPGLCRQLTVFPRFTIPDLTLQPIQLTIPRLVFHAKHVIDHVIFDTNNIPDRHRLLLDESATELIDNINLVTDITGHTDSKGGTAYNQSLSERRARAVQQHFLDRNVSASKIWSVTGKGERERLFNDDATNPLSASRNRRIELDMRRMIWNANIPRPSLNVPPLQMPNSALGLQDTRQRVRDAERPQFERLRTFMHRIRNEIGQLLAAPPAGTQPFINADNENITSMLQVMDRLNNDLDAEQLIIRFDQPGNTRVAASFTLFEDTIHIQPLTNNNTLPSVAVDLIHEYAHSMQDRTAEQLQRAARIPLAHTREDELRQEIEGRRHETYLLLLLASLGHRFEFDKEINARVFVNRFERERTGNPATQTQARREIRTAIEGPYTGQLATNAPMRRYLVEIHSDRHAHLVRENGVTVDLGLVPAGRPAFSPLEAVISTRITQSGICPNLFTDNQGNNYTIIQVLVFDGNQKIGEFGMEPGHC